MDSGTSKNDKPVRVFIDGCFDMVHYGHANAIRQAKQMGEHLTVGVHCDEEISIHKGPPVYTQEERYELIRAIKWVDDVYEGSPYLVNIPFLDSINVDFDAHGDDVSVLAGSGEDVYLPLKKGGRYREFKRTQGISTTDLVGRMLLLTKKHHESDEEVKEYAKELSDIGQDYSTTSPYTSTCQFLATSQKIVQFSSGREPKPGDKIVYTAGAFDLLHIGHIKFLEKLSKMGDFVYVGVHSDQVVNNIKGSNYPIMNMHERVLGLLACRYVSEVIIGAPYKVTGAMMDHLKVDLVVHGSTYIVPDVDGVDPYAEPKNRGKFQLIKSGCSETTGGVVARIIRNRIDFEIRNTAKERREKEMIITENCQNGDGPIDDEICVNIDTQNISIKG